MLKNMQIRTRLITAFLIVILMMALTGVVSIVMLSKVGASLQGFYDTSLQTIEQSWKGKRAAALIRANVLQATLDDDDTRSNGYMTSTRTEYQTLQDAAATLKNTYTGDKSVLTTLDTTISNIGPTLERLFTYANNHDVQNGYLYLREQYEPLADSVRAQLDKIGQDADQAALDTVDTGKTLSTTANVLVITLVILSAAVGIVLAIVIANGIVNPVNEMQEVTLAVSQGDFESDIKYHSKDALGSLADNMRHLTATIKEIITDVEMQLAAMGDGNFNVRSRKEEMYLGSFARLQTAMTKLTMAVSETMAQIDVSADQVNSGGEQISSSAQAMAQGATEQASSVQELAATIGEISHAVEETAEHAQNAKVDNQASHDQIAVCSAHMADLMGAMKAIEVKSLEISKVIKTIEDIAFQTNILALNAAVEAARAGSAGKGFAVVADEVRNLATKSQEASKSTATLIEETVKAVNEGSRLSVETDEALKEVVIRAQKVMDAVTRISKATDAQSHDVAQVSTGIDQISSVVQTNSATAEESAAASEQLSGQANLLKELIGRFTLRKEVGGARSTVAAAHSGDSFSASSSAHDKY
ncbi:MAG: MCP four helix bundle domain-containing protein [Oscillibacter sp.]|nr:MCP four helix bundle domain-containing protein [Oscillibacter sp.]